MQSKIIIVILLMALVTFLPRFLPLLFLSKRKLSPLAKSWLSYVPVAVLSALLGPALFLKDGQFNLTLSSNPYFWAALPTFAVALRTRNMFLAVLTGIGSIALLRMFVS
ncbi:MAG: AzlD domain-containing protein [Firmicutes bacterium]|jgi:branched-subunit amino acid transport protein|nr:AzlD domain-containing protein [Bacillota bacterium]